jgi:ribosome-associated translation inhibitor RaiA/cold shock CspA family protein
MSIQPDPKTGQPARRDRLVQEAVHDAYAEQEKAAEPAVCPECDAALHHGRWTWDVPEPGATPHLCPACRRIRDDYPAGRIALSGPAVKLQRQEILGVVENEEALEKAEHPLHRVMRIEWVVSEDEMEVATTDVHLPRRIGNALAHAYGGDLQISYPEGEDSVQVSWKSGEARGAAVGRPAPAEVEFPLHLVSRAFALTGEIESEIRKRAVKLPEFYPRITSCRLVVDAPIPHRRSGGPYSVNIEIVLPGAVLRVNRQHGDLLQPAIRQAFDALYRQLEDHARRERGTVKHHEALPVATVSELFPDEDYGFLETAEEERLYFHRKSVLPPGFDSIGIGSRVRFHREEGDKGAQASTVTPLAS